MVQNDFLLSLLGYNGQNVNTEADTNNEFLDYNNIKNIIKEEMLQCISALATIHADTEEYKTVSENLKTLSEILSNLEKSETESKKTAIQIQENQNKRLDSQIQMVTKISGILAYAGLVAFWIGLERNSTIPQKLVNGMNQLVRPSV